MKSSRLAWYSRVRFDMSKIDTRAPGGGCGRVAPQLRLDGRHRLRGAMRGEVIGVLDGRIGHILPGGQVVEQADPEGFVRIDHPARQEQVAGTARTDQL